MPFYSRDWRSPGEHWIKTKDGWEKQKILEFDQNSRNSKYCHSNNNSNNLEDENKENAIINEPFEITAKTDVSRNVSEISIEPCSDRPHSSTSPPPYCQLTKRSTKEVKQYTGFSDVIKRLDFRSALHDVKRFAYVCKTLELLINGSVMSLPGTAQRAVFALLEEMARLDSSQGCTNMRLLRQLISRLDTVLSQCQVSGQCLGSHQLWQKHRQTLLRVRSATQLGVSDNPCPPTPALGSSPHTPPATTQLCHMPLECLRAIVCCLSDHRDLCSVASLTTPAPWQPLARVACERGVWRCLCDYHFTAHQQRAELERLRRQRRRVEALYANCDHAPPAACNAVEAPDAIRLQSGDEGRGLWQWDLAPDRIDWQMFYHCLKRSHGLREEFAECLHLCRVCQCVFWPSSGHPCMLCNDYIASPQQQAAMLLPIADNHHQSVQSCSPVSLVPDDSSVYSNSASCSVIPSSQSACSSIVSINSVVSFSSPPNFVVSSNPIPSFISPPNSVISCSVSSSFVPVSHSTACVSTTHEQYCNIDSLHHIPLPPHTFLSFFTL